MEKQELITAAEQYVIDYVLKLRVDKSLTQQDVANIIGVSRSFINDVESDRPAKYNIRHINAMADYFGISPREFLPEKAFPVDAPADVPEKPVKVVKKKAVKKVVKKVAKKAVKKKRAQ